MTIKPHNPTITINGDIYFKEPDQDHLTVSIYTNKEKRRRVSIEWSKFFKCWYILFKGDCQKAFYELDEPIFVPEEIIPEYHFSTEEELMKIDLLLTQVLLNVSK